MNSSAALARQAGMTDAQWKEAVKFDSTDWGWIIMSIGMAIGAGMYPIGLATTIIIILMQVIMHRFNIGNDALATRDINITMKDTRELRDAFLAELKKMDVTVIGSHITHNGDGTVNYGLTVKFSREISYEDILLFMDNHPDIINIAM